MPSRRTSIRPSRSPTASSFDSILPSRSLSLIALPLLLLQLLDLFPELRVSIVEQAPHHREGLASTSGGGSQRSPVLAQRPRVGLRQPFDRLIQADRHNRVTAFPGELVDH